MLGNVPPASPLAPRIAGEWTPVGRTHTRQRTTSNYLIGQACVDTFFCSLTALIASAGSWSFVGSSAVSKSSSPPSSSSFSARSEDRNQCAPVVRAPICSSRFLDQGRKVCLGFAFCQLDSRGVGQVFWALGRRSSQRQGCLLNPQLVLEFWLHHQPQE